jgi:hypothetical protein
MSEARIEFKGRPGAEKELWAIRVGNWSEINDSAQGLLEELRDEHPRALVYVNGRRIQLRRTS